MLPPANIKKVLHAQLKQLETKRLSVVKYKRVDVKDKVQNVLLLVALFGGGGLVMYRLHPWSGEFWMYVVAVTAIIGAMIYGDVRAALVTRQEHLDLQTAVQQKAYRPVLQAWNPTVDYEPQQKIRESAFAKAQLYPDYTRYRGAHLCKGNLPDGRKFQFCELLLQKADKKAKFSKKSGCRQSRRSAADNCDIKIRYLHILKFVLTCR